MATEPERHWRPQDMATAMGTIKESTLAQVMSAWSHKGLLTKTAPGVYVRPGKPTDQDNKAESLTDHCKPIETSRGATPPLRQPEHQFAQVA